MSSNNEHNELQVIPKGKLEELNISQIKPSPYNPRILFDDIPLAELKQSIKNHGVLVPITVYKLAGQDKYAIVDGERRYRCCEALAKEGKEIKIPANIVETPNKIASIVYMFNIHAFRENWELMPIAKSIEEVIKTLEVDDPKELHEITGLSLSQIERCKKILSFSKEFQNLSLDLDPSKRIPPNFWVELHPVLDKIETLNPDLYDDLGRDEITRKMVEKYRNKKITSVIHFRRILEAIENAKDIQEVADRIREYILTPDLETREAFDGFIEDTRKVQKAIKICDNFITKFERTHVEYAIEDKDDLIVRLKNVIDIAQKYIDKLQGSDHFGDSDDFVNIKPEEQ